MALPRIDTPTYQTNLPSTGQSVQFRPFLVKEQKIPSGHNSDDYIDIFSIVERKLCTSNITNSESSD